MAPLRRPCLSVYTPAERKKPGPKPKSIEERGLPVFKPLQRIERSYTRERKIQVLCFLYHYRVPYSTVTGEQTRRIKQEEVASIFLIPASTISTWWNTREKIVQSSVGERTVRSVFVCQWPEMEVLLFSAFSQRREEGKTVRRNWFRQTSSHLFQQSYPQLEKSVFCFSSGWFHGFLSRHNITLRFTTNKAQKVPKDYQQLIINWLKFNRRNSQPRSTRFLEMVIPQAVGRYRLSNICNLDETPIPFEYLDGRTYNERGSKTVWAKTTKSGWDKRQATLILCIFADGVSRIPPVILFHGTGSDRMKSERRLYNKRVIVDFNATAYNNEKLFLQYIDKYLLPALQGRPSLFAFDCVEFHKTPAIRAKLRAHDVIPSLIPPGCTGLVQPLDVSINAPLKCLLRDLTDDAIEKRGKEIDKWTVSERRVLTTHCVAQAWDDFCLNKRSTIIESFQNVGLSLPVDGSCDHKLKIKGFDSEDLVIGDWREGGLPDVEDELPLGRSIAENTVLNEKYDDSTCIDYIEGGTLVTWSISTKKA